MASSTSWRARVAEVVGPVGATERLAGGAWLVTAAGRSLVAKLGRGVLDEAEGLGQLHGVPNAPPVPEVVLAEGELLVTSFVAHGPRTDAHEEALGRSLAALHRAPSPYGSGNGKRDGGGNGEEGAPPRPGGWGGGSSWIGACPVDASVYPDAPSFYGARLSDLARRCGLERPVDAVVARLPELLPPSGQSSPHDPSSPGGGAALLHGDLWWGNVLWGTDGRGWVIDPSVHGGHPEEDLAMLGLFGRVPDRLLRAYDEVRPLEAGWEERVELFQLYPLLVHTVLFGGGYRDQAEAIARRYGRG